MEKILAKPPVSLETLEHTPVEPSECGLYWVTPDGKRLRPLTPAHKKFCQLYALLRKNPLIGNHIIELIKIEQERAVVSMDSHLTELSHLRDEAKITGQISAAISAEVSRGRVAGLYIEKKEVLVSKVETMSDEELASKLKQLLDGDNMKVVNDVQHREEIVSSTEDEHAEGSLAEDRDGSVAAGST